MAYNGLFRRNGPGRPHDQAQPGTGTPDGVVQQFPERAQLTVAAQKRRLQGAKPGITGLWQVDGRSRVKFDDMVRIDLRYAKACSLWLDVKILLQTPGAVFSGDGAC